MLRKKAFETHYLRIKRWQTRNPGKVRLVNNKVDEDARLCNQSLSLMKKWWLVGHISKEQIETLNEFDVWRHRVGNWERQKRLGIKRGFRLFYPRVKAWQICNPDKYTVNYLLGDKQARLCVKALTALKRLWSSGKLTVEQLDVLNELPVWRARMERWSVGKPLVKKERFCLYYDSVKKWQYDNPGKTSLTGFRSDKLERSCEYALIRLKRMLVSGCLTKERLKLLGDFAIWRKMLEMWEEEDY